MSPKLETNNNTRCGTQKVKRFLGKYKIPSLTEKLVFTLLGGTAQFAQLWLHSLLFCQSPIAPKFELLPFRVFRAFQLNTLRSELSIQVSSSSANYLPIQLSSAFSVAVNLHLLTNFFSLKRHRTVATTRNSRRKCKSVARSRPKISHFKFLHVKMV